MDYTVHRILQARILELRGLSLLQQIFLTQELNQGLLHFCRWILYQLSYQGNLWIGRGRYSRESKGSEVQRILMYSKTTRRLGSV